MDIRPKTGADRPSTHHRVGRVVSMLSCAGLLLLAGTAPTRAATSPNPTPKASKAVAAPGAKQANPLPAVTVTDVRTGKPFRLASALTGKKPLLVWFWAPT